MNKSIVIAFVLIVSLPLLLVAWLGWRSIKTEREGFQEQLKELRLERLQTFTGFQSLWIQQLESQLSDSLIEQSKIPLGEWPSNSIFNRFSNQFFALNTKGELIYPSSAIAPLTTDEVKTIELFETGLLLVVQPNDSTDQTSSTQGWSTWFEGPGQQWAFWLSRNGVFVGMILNRSALLSEAIAHFPETPDLQDGAEDTFVVFDEKGSILYLWGPEKEIIKEELDLIPMPSPFNLWQVSSISPLGMAPPWYRQTALMVLVFNISLISLLTLLAAWYVYTRTQREFKQARQRVSFVNQVSHEFKTPLTNIQLYAELMEDTLEEGSQIKNLSVIQEEARKLNRLIQNVLSFAKNRKTGIKPHTRSLVPDECIQQILTTHQPALTRRGIELKPLLKAKEAIAIDREILEQILGNLLSNVEKYAPGSSVVIESTQQTDCIHVTVRDSGPGISLTKAAVIFDPFVRIHDKTTEGVSGTGIGLSIARDLARLHGGDLWLTPGETGATFTFSLKSVV